MARATNELRSQRQGRLLGLLFCCSARFVMAGSGQDLKLSYRSPIDGSDQFYRLYVPSSHAPDRPTPLVVALHQTGADENSFFDDERHYPAREGLKNAAERFGVIAVCPNAWGNTVYRGPGENAVFCVLEDVKRRFRIDEDRIYLTGHSMGGTGAADIALHHPDLFAAVAPLAAARGIRWLAANAGHVPFWWIGGGKDRDYYKRGVAAGVERMQELGCPVRFTELPGEDHYGPGRNFNRVVEWLVQHRRVTSPAAFTFEVDTLRHARAYWITVEAIERPGRIAVVKAAAESRHRAALQLENIAALSIWPDPAVFDLERPIEVHLPGMNFSSKVTAEQEVYLAQSRQGWRALVRPRRAVSRIAYRVNPVTFAPEELNLHGTESTLGNWIADAMRFATAADIALYNHRASTDSRPIRPGVVDVVDLLQCSLPGDQELVVTELRGRDIEEILADNIPDRAEQGRAGVVENPIVQVSGAKYVFDWRLPQKQRIVMTSLDPGKTYTVALEGQVVERETIRLAGRFRRLEYRRRDVSFTMALYGYAAHSAEMRAPLEGRVREVK